MSVRLNRPCDVEWRPGQLRFASARECVPSTATTVAALAQRQSVTGRSDASRTTVSRRRTRLRGFRTRVWLALA